MKTTKGLLGFFAAIALLSVNRLFAQSLPNDNFDNRTVLTGSVATLSGSLAGATLENGETNGTYYWMPTPGSGSLWWTWTAPISGPVVFSLSSPSWMTNRIGIYSGDTLGALSLKAWTAFVRPVGRYLRFDATAGTTYQIQIVGSDIRPFSLQLIATNQPVFIVQPKDCVVSPYGSAFFSAMATRGYLYPMTLYQWYFNGVPIAGQTYPSLVIHGVTTNQAGTYSVVASNDDGVAQSISATLTVADTNPVPTLAVLPSTNPNLHKFNLTGEPGRWYLVESSTNLQNWVNPTWLQITNPTIPVSIQRLAPNHFVRASLDVPTEVCVAQLKQMQWGVTLFAIENQKDSSANYSLYDVHWYCPLASNGQMSPCPEGAIYTPGGTVTDAPTCTLHARGHVIPDL